MQAQCTKPLAVCEHCGTTFTQRDHRPKSFCTRQCHAAARTIPAEDRFWPKVDKSGPIPAHCPELGPCWPWTGSRHEFGYGMFSYDGRSRYAHVFAYTLTYGKPRRDKPHVLHKCDGGNIGCVRPSHLFTGTNADNMADKVAKGRQLRGERHSMAKLTESQVRKIRERYAGGGIRQRDLAAEFGVSQPLVSAILSGKLWT